MKALTTQEMAMLFLALGVMLATARLFGEFAKRLKQPAVLGEILSGILLGPTFLGHLAPGVASALFPTEGANAVVRQGIANLAVALFLLVAGMEVNLSSVWRQGRTAITVSLGGIIVPFAVGMTAAWFGGPFFAREPGGDPLVFALFFATALSISAMAVIAKTLMDINLFRTDLGMTIMAAAILEDFAGWVIFAMVLGMMGGHAHTFTVPQTLGLTVAYALTMLTVGRWLMHRILPWLQAHTSWPGGVLGFTLALAFCGAAFTEWVGVHAVFGAFIVGVAIGDSDHLRERTRSVIEQFVSFIFAPLFFASIGLKVNFFSYFDLRVVLAVLAVACLGKVIGCSLGARLAGMRGREALAVGFGMNARGTMEIVMGSLGLSYGLINERLFVALVVMTVTTAGMSGPIMQRILRRKKSRQFGDYLTEKTFVSELDAPDASSAIYALAQAVAPATPFNSTFIAAAALAREQLMPTGIGSGVACPHARLKGLKTPLVAVGVSKTGIDFRAPDGQSARLIFLLLTPQEDDSAQLELIADLAQTFRRSDLVKAALQTKNFTEFLALIRTREATTKRHAAAA